MTTTSLILSVKLSAIAQHRIAVIIEILRVQFQLQEVNKSKLLFSMVDNC